MIVSVPILVAIIIAIITIIIAVAAIVYVKVFKQPKPKVIDVVATPPTADVSTLTQQHNDTLLAQQQSQADAKKAAELEAALNRLIQGNKDALQNASTTETADLEAQIADQEAALIKARQEKEAAQLAQEQALLKSQELSRQIAELQAKTEAQKTATADLLSQQQLEAAAASAAINATAKAAANASAQAAADAAAKAAANAAANAAASAAINAAAKATANAAAKAAANAQAKAAANAAAKAAANAAAANAAASAAINAAAQAAANAQAKAAANAIAKAAANAIAKAAADAVAAQAAADAAAAQAAADAAAKALITNSVKTIILSKKTSVSFQIAEIEIYNGTTKLTKNDLTVQIASGGTTDGYGQSPLVLFDQSNITRWGSGTVFSSGEDRPETVTITLNTEQNIDKIVIYNRTDCCWDRLNGMTMTLMSSTGKTVAAYMLTSDLVQTFNINAPTMVATTTPTTVPIVTTVATTTPTTTTLTTTPTTTTTTTMTTPTPTTPTTTTTPTPTTPLTTSQYFGAGLGYWAGTNTYDLTCSGSDYVTGMYGYFGPAAGTGPGTDMSAIGIRCTSGNNPPIAGTPLTQTTKFDVSCPTGFDAADLNAGWGLTKVDPKCNGVSSDVVITSADGGGPFSYACPAGTKLKGITGKYGARISNIAFKCGN